jgi:peptide/nickel transport system permease protein
LWNYSGPASSAFYKSLDSYSNDIVTGLGIVGAGAGPSDYLFGGPGKYDLVLQMNLPAGFQGHLLVQSLKLNLYGNTWGIMGTDDGGQDIFTQFVYGARLSIYVGLAATIIGIALGLTVGLMAGYLGKIVDEVLMRFTDMILVIPFLPLLIVLSFVLGPSLNTIVLIIGLLSWPGFARLIRSQVLSIRERPFIEAAKASGAGTAYILAKHVFPNIIALTYVNLALSVPAAIVGEAALSFLGLGDPTQVTWGKMLELARAAGSAGSLTWWWIIPPGIGIAILSLSFILVGYSLDELFNPRLRRRR